MLQTVFKHKTNKKCIDFFLHRFLRTVWFKNTILSHIEMIEKELDKYWKTLFIQQKWQYVPCESLCLNNATNIHKDTLFTIHKWGVGFVEGSKPYLDSAVLWGTGDNVVIVWAPLHIQHWSGVSTHSRGVLVHSTALVVRDVKTMWARALLWKYCWFDYADNCKYLKHQL